MHLAPPGMFLPSTSLRSREAANQKVLATIWCCGVVQGQPLPDAPLALPDVDGVFAPAASLCVNDAAWLPAGGARLVHPEVPLHAAEALGAQSLRFHHQVRFLLQTCISGIEKVR